MVKAKVRGENVELAVLLPVADRPLGNSYSGDGFNYADLKSHGFNITVTPREFANFVEALTMAFFEYQLERAAAVQKEVDEVTDSV